MDRIPDRVTSDLRTYYREEEASETLEALARQFFLPQVAKDFVQDEDRLKSIVNDGELAPSLSRIFRNLQSAIDGNAIAREAVFSACARLEKQLTQWAMENDDCLQEAMEQAGER